MAAYGLGGIVGNDKLGKDESRKPLRGPLHVVLIVLVRTLALVPKENIGLAFLETRVLEEVFLRDDSRVDEHAARKQGVY